MKEYERFSPGYENIAEFYDYFAQDDDLPFFLKYAQQQKSPILDLAAGAGRVTTFLASEGFDVTALEKSPSMFNELQKQMSLQDAATSSRIVTVNGDMCSFNLNQRFSLVLIPASFGHAITTEQQLSTLAAVRRHLSDEGLFILDLIPAAILPEHSIFEEPPVELPDGRVVIRSGEVSCDFMRQIMTANLKYTISHPNNRTDVRQVTSHAALIFNREADLLICSSGFEVVEEFGSFSKEPYTHDSNKRILILKKSIKE